MSAFFAYAIAIIVVLLLLCGFGFLLEWFMGQRPPMHSKTELTVDISLKSANDQQD